MIEDDGAEGFVDSVLFDAEISAKRVLRNPKRIPMLVDAAQLVVLVAYTAGLQDRNSTSAVFADQLRGVIRFLTDVHDKVVKQ